MKKKILSLVLALLMAASSASAVLADEAIADVEETAVVEEVAEAGQYDKAIAFLANYGIFKGISADDLGADLDVQRYQMALFVARVSTGWTDDDVWEDGPENWSEFSDISEGAVANYWGALSYVNQKGIIEGYGNGKFGPTDGITYQNALTMTVRTLGYTGLEWPWGYIEKAVALGLTDGITDVAYTDELTRGEVAQIIYNAMFAKTKGGSTLALDNFGIAFGWEKIVVTASDLNTFVPDTKDAVPALKDETYAKYDKSNKPASGLVSFQILNDDGTLADDVYYVAKEALGLVGDHDDELAVGDAYYVLFEQDKEDNFVDVVAYESLYVDTLVNAGKTDDDAVEVDEYEIEEFVDDYSFVSKYSNSAYINMTKATKPEAIVFVANNEVEIVTGTDYVIAIDWATGDILVPADDDWAKDEKFDAKTAEYKLKYSWNTTLNKYYEVVFDRDVEKFEDIAINWISPAEMEKLLKDYTLESKKNVSGFNKAVDSLTKSAYAALKLFDTNLDGVADRGIYETYRLGYFKNEAKNYDCGCGKLDSYVISYVDVLAQAFEASEIANGEGKADVTKDVVTVREEGLKCKHNNYRGWIVDDSLLVDAVDEEGEETGYYAPAYVVYNYDKETGAIKIVKNITDGADEDSFVAKGIVRAYNVTKGTITIGEETYDINGYNDGWNTLIGNGFKYANDKYFQKAVYSALLRSLFNQFVEYVVVDGEIVTIKAIKADKGDELIVVESYAGLSSDGYIVVNGYSTDDLTYDRFRIGSYDGWQQGDAFYYMTDEKVEEYFSNGSIYSIASYDAEEDLYFVNVVDADEVASSKIKFEVEAGSENAADGYLTKSYEYSKKTQAYTKSKDVKMSSKDTYIIVLDGVANSKYAPVMVYTGKLPEGASIEGQLIKEDGNTYVFVSAAVTGISKVGVDSGAVILLKDTYFKAAYDGVDAEEWYLLGASEFEVAAFDVFTGKEVTVLATNKKLETGVVYPTQGNYITSDKGWTLATATGLEAFIEATIVDGNYIVNDIADILPKTALFNNKDNGHRKALEKVIIDDEGSINGVTKNRGELVDDITYRVIKIDEDGFVTEISDAVGANDKGDSLTNYAKKNNYSAVPAVYVYNVDAETAVIYLIASEATETVVEKYEAKDDIALEGRYAKVVATLTGTKTTVNEDLSKVEVKNITLDIVPDDANITHANVENYGLHFTVTSASYTVNGTETVVLSNIVDETYDCEKDCALVKTVCFDLTDADGNGAVIDLTDDVADVITVVVGGYTDTITIAADATITIAADDIVG